MKKNYLILFVGILCLICFLPGFISRSAGGETILPTDPKPGPCVVNRVGRITDNRLIECSGFETSNARENLFWAINDGGCGPYVYAMDKNGRSKGRVLIKGAKNRDWEGMDSFLWHGRSMLLVADVGDNRQQYDHYTLYVVPEPRLEKTSFDATAHVEIAWQIKFSYPDHPHDAESVSVDGSSEKILILTKRDPLPLLFELPLKPGFDDQSIMARNIGRISNIPSPSAQDLLEPYGIFRSQPTAMDIASDGRRLVVLTYKHAYLYARNPEETWDTAFKSPPQTIILPLPQNCPLLRQREAVCFSHHGSAIFVTSEGKMPGIFKMKYDLPEGF